MQSDHMDFNDMVEIGLPLWRRITIWAFKGCWLLGSLYSGLILPFGLGSCCDQSISISVMDWLHCVWVASMNPYRLHGFPDGQPP